MAEHESGRIPQLIREGYSYGSHGKEKNRAVASIDLFNL